MEIESRSKFIKFENESRDFLKPIFKYESNTSSEDKIQVNIFFYLFFQKSSILLSSKTNNDLDSNSNSTVVNDNNSFLSKKK